MFSDGDSRALFSSAVLLVFLIISWFSHVLNLDWFYEFIRLRLSLGIRERFAWVFLFKFAVFLNSYFLECVKFNGFQSLSKIRQLGVLGTHHKNFSLQFDFVFEVEILKILYSSKNWELKIDWIWPTLVFPLFKILLQNHWIDKI
jgi:hypothetical protein